MVSFFSTQRAWFAVASLGMGSWLSGCSSLNSASEQVASVITPYRAELVQGNAVTRERLDLVKVGMLRDQVRAVLGTPLVASVFHANRWDYVFVLYRDGQMLQKRRLTLLFNGDVLASMSGDEVPTEAEFVASIGKKKLGAGAVPLLEATPEQVAKFPVPVRPAPEAPAAISPPSGRYPPLEPVAR
jgi:outer membrane protein assembly factor BamE